MTIGTEFEIIEKLAELGLLDEEFHVKIENGHIEIMEMNLLDFELFSR